MHLRRRERPTGSLEGPADGTALSGLTGHRGPGWSQSA
jgi:hypothetical protein